MTYRCCVNLKTGKRKGETCNNNIQEKEIQEQEEKYKVIIEGEKYYVCKKHAGKNNIEIDIVKYKSMEKENKSTNSSDVFNNIESEEIIKNKSLDNKLITSKIKKDKSNTEDKTSDIINDFEKMNINNSKNDKDDKYNENNEKDGKYTKKPCLQHIIYLISNDNNDVCQFEDCQFAHNINIIYT